MAVQPDQNVHAAMSRNQRIALRLIQVAVLSFAIYRLLRVNQVHSGVYAIGWSIPWAILAAAAILLVPTLIRLGWRRFGRLAPTWAIATVVSVSVWGVVTVLCWMALSIVLILSD